MLVKLDENLPTELIDALAALGHDVHNVPEEGLTASADERIWDACQREGRFPITQDLDYSDVRRFVPGRTLD